MATSKAQLDGSDPCVVIGVFAWVGGTSIYGEGSKGSKYRPALRERGRFDLASTCNVHRTYSDLSQGKAS